MKRHWLAVALCGLTLGGCADRSSDIAVAYRGDIAAYRQLVRVQLDTGSRARVITPAFPSAAHPEPIASGGALPITVMMLSGGDTIARYSAPPVSLAPGTSYVISVIVSVRAPKETRCTGRWAATPIVPRGANAAEPATAGSLYVSMTSRPRGGTEPDCGD